MASKFRSKALLLSLPWAGYQCPSVAIASLAAYAQNEGFDVDNLHLHLNIAASVGPDIYDKFTYDTSSTIGEAIFLPKLCPTTSTRSIQYVKKYIPEAASLAQRLHCALLKEFEKINFSQYTVVGFTANYQQLFASLLFASWIKKKHPTIYIIMGGTSASGKLGRSVIKSFPQVDACISGEGEIPFISLLKNIYGNRPQFEKHTPALIYRDNGTIRSNPEEQLSNLNSYPDPDYQTYFDNIENNPDIHKHDIRPYLPIEVSRGCRHKCTFCADHTFFKGLRIRDGHEVLESMKRLSFQYKIGSIALLAEDISSTLKNSLFDRLQTANLDYRLSCSTRCSLPFDELKKMKNAGVIAIEIGIEAFSTNLLRKMNKGTRVIDNLEIMKRCEELGISHTSNMIIAFPTESQQDVDESLRCFDFAQSFMPPYRLAPFKLIDGSPVYKQPSRYKIHSIGERGLLHSLLPPDLQKNLLLINKTYKSSCRKREYKRLEKAYNEWNLLYEDAKETGRSLLFYLDSNNRTIIEDHRNGSSILTLQGLTRTLFLKCREKTSFADLVTIFNNTDKASIKSTLDELIKLKIMYEEDKYYLSLPIQITNNGNRYLSF